jgi:hypothetical protein
MRPAPDVPSAEPAMTAKGLMLAGTTLAEMGCDRHGTLGLVVDGAEERILGLLALTYDRSIAPGVLGNIRRASHNGSAVNRFSPQSISPSTASRRSTMWRRLRFASASATSSSPTASPRATS